MKQPMYPPRDEEKEAIYGPVRLFSDVVGCRVVASGSRAVHTCALQ